MHINQKKHTSRKIILAVLLLIAIIATVLTYGMHKKYITNPFDQNQSSTEPTKEQEVTQKKTEAQEKSEFINRSKEKSSTGVDSSKPAPVPTSSDTIEVISSQKDGSVVIITKLKAAGYSSGSCDLSITANGKTLAQHAEIMYQPEYSTCTGFTVPISNLGNGDWDTTITVTPLNGSALTNNQMIRVK